jgi:YegS/Rv2252/BmrU family lipid kinase
MTYTFIVNPAAGRGRVRKKLPCLVDQLKHRAFRFDLVATSYAGEARALARQAAARSDVVVAVGGDGTVHEVANGLLAAPNKATLGVLPLGSGNDFAAALGMPVQIEAGLDALQRAQLIRLDTGRVAVTEPSRRYATCFVNSLGVGFDAAVAAEAATQKLLPGLLGYAWAAIRSLRTWSSPQVEIVGDKNGSDEGFTVQGNLLLFALGNGPRVGGGFRLTPEASFCDGQLDVCVVEHLPMWRILPLIPIAIRGRHGDVPEVTMTKVTAVHLKSVQPLPVHADGEVISFCATELRVAIQPGTLPVLVPELQIETNGALGSRAIV